MTLHASTLPETLSLPGRSSAANPIMSIEDKIPDLIALDGDACKSRCGGGPSKADLQERVVHLGLAKAFGKAKLIDLINNYLSQSAQLKEIDPSSLVKDKHTFSSMCNLVIKPC